MKHGEYIKRLRETLTTLDYYFNPKKCERCSGKGIVYTLGYDGKIIRTDRCPECDGRGKK